MKSGARWPSSSDELQRFLRRWNWNRAGSNLSELMITWPWYRDFVAPTPRGRALRRGQGGHVLYLSWEHCDWNDNKIFVFPSILVMTEKSVGFGSALCFPKRSPNGFVKFLLPPVTRKLEWTQRKDSKYIKSLNNSLHWCLGKKRPKNTYTPSFGAFSTFKRYEKCPEEYQSEW